ncbi:hypothetical protein NEAUS04_0692 [Nematocida ausubeli]|nr:hypothetical protein NEAUS04_0692 [Nematocida ausubeli]
MTENNQATRTQSNGLSLVRIMKKYTKKVIKLPRSTYKKVKKGVKYIAKKTFSVFKRSKKDRQNRGSLSKPVGSEGNKSSVVAPAATNGPEKTRIYSTKFESSRHARPMCEEQSKQIIGDIMNDTCKYIHKIERIVKNNTRNSIDAHIPLAILKYMRANELKISIELEAAELKYIENTLKEKQFSNESVPRRMPTNIRTKNCILEELQPTLYLKYLFAHSPVLRKSYTSLYNTVSASLTVRSPGATHAVDDVVLYIEVTRQVKIHIVEKISRLKRTSCNFVLYSCKTAPSNLE